MIGQVALSRGKRSITLDMRDPASAAVLARLSPTADVVVENARSGAMAERGFGYEQARGDNPGLIWCAITGLGQDGPGAGHAGHDLSCLARSGLIAALSPDRSWQPGLSLSLQAGALAAVLTIRAALIRRGPKGEGGGEVIDRLLEAARAPAARA